MVKHWDLPWANQCALSRNSRGEPLDAVSNLQAHQQHLRPKAVKARHVLLAMPPLFFVQLPALKELLRWRAVRLKNIAKYLGGGDGPIQVVDLADGLNLPALLRGLHKQGIRQLTLVGAQDQPDFHREIACRWSERLTCFEDEDDFALEFPSLGQLLHRETSQQIPLSDRVVIGSPLMDIPLQPCTVLLGLSADQDPLKVLQSIVAPRETVIIPYYVDPCRQCGAYAGLFPPRALFATEEGLSLRQIWTQYWLKQGIEDPVRPGCLGLNTALEKSLFSSLPPELPKSGEPLGPIFALCGLDGSGKSTQAQALAKHLSLRGQPTTVLKLYRQGAFLELANDLSARLQGGAPLRNLKWSREVKMLDSMRVLTSDLLPRVQRNEVLICDRYLETHIAAAGSQLGWDIRKHPLLRFFPQADHNFWMKISAKDALKRLVERKGCLTADEHLLGLEGYALFYDVLSKEMPGLTVDAHLEQLENGKRILQTALDALPGAQDLLKKASGFDGDEAQSLVLQEGIIKQSSKSTISVAPKRIRSQGVDLWVGEPRPGDIVLGDGCLDLFSNMGTQSLELSRAFCLRAWLSQVILDLDCSQEEKCSLPLWPGTLAKMPLFRHVNALQEAQKLIENRARSIHFAELPLSPVLWSILSPENPQRLSHAYERLWHY